ncbi:MAG: amphi-Trp domain-containing protein [Haloglomus sp.]
MPEEVLFESESMRSRSEVATYLRDVAEALEADGAVTLSAGDQSISVTPPNRVEFEVKVEREGPAEGPGELGIELELEWDEDAPDDGQELSIE